jgi:hypothetical protein
MEMDRLRLAPDGEPVDHRSRRRSSGDLPVLDIGWGLFALADSLIKETALPLAQRDLFEVPRRFIPQLLDKADSIFRGERAKSFKDLPGIHPGPSPPLLDRRTSKTCSRLTVGKPARKSSIVAPHSR